MSRRDDILKRKRAYEDAYSRRTSENTEYTKMLYSVLNKLTELVKSKIGDTSLNLNVSSDHDFRDQITVTVNNGNNPHDEQALNWNWSVSLTPEGEIKRDSGSWSGLSAITPQHLENLKESVRVLEILNNIDWANILNVELPQYDDYVKTQLPENEDFDHQLLEEDVKDAIAEGKLIKGHGYKYYNHRAVVFYHILKENPKSFTVQEIYEDDLSDESRWPAPYTIQKDKLYSVVDNPINTAEV